MDGSHDFAGRAITGAVSAAVCNLYEGESNVVCLREDHHDGPLQASGMTAHY